MRGRYYDYGRRSGYSRLNPFEWGSGVLAALCVLLVVVFAGYGCASYYKEDTITLTVSGKESIAKDSGHEYRVYTDEETCVVKDSLVKGRFRSSNEYAALKEGYTYECKKFGWRIPFFSAFENLKDCREVARPSKQAG